MSHTPLLGLQLFTDPAFLFCFAPVVLTLYYLFPPSWRNAFLLLSSFLLYAWGEGRNVAALLTSVAINYACESLIGRGVILHIYGDLIRGGCLPAADQS